MQTEPVETGVIKFYNPNKKFGFIICTDGSEIFFHANDRSDTGSTPKERQQVVFTRDAQGKKLKAVNWSFATAAQEKPREEQTKQGLATIADAAIASLDDTVQQLLPLRVRRRTYTVDADGEIDQIVTNDVVSEWSFFENYLALSLTCPRADFSYDPLSYGASKEGDRHWVCLIEVRLPNGSWSTLNLDPRVMICSCTIPEDIFTKYAPSGSIRPRCNHLT